MKRYRLMIVMIACLATAALGCVAAAAWIVAAPAKDFHPATEICLHLENDTLVPLEKNYSPELTGSGLVSSSVSEMKEHVKVVDQFGRNYKFELEGSGLSDGERDFMSQKLAGSTYIAKYEISTITTENDKILKSDEFRWADGEAPTIECLIKYQSVWHTANSTVGAYNKTDELYTIEDALEQFGSGTIIVEYNTSFATTEVAKLAGYTDKTNAYNVRGTLLVPYGASANNSAFQNVKEDGGLYSSATLSQATDRASTTTATHNNTQPNHTAGYSKLTVVSGIDLQVGGSLIVNGVLTMLNGASSYVYGANYGELVVEQDAQISISGATFDCMGFASGKGKIVVSSSSHVYEPMNLSGFKGHNVTIAISNTIFPISQFTLAHIACHLEMDATTTYQTRAYIRINGGGVDYSFLKTANLLGSSSSYFIQLAQGATFIKSIDTDPSQKTAGTITFQLNGNVSINNLNILNENLPILGRINISTQNRQIPIAGHFNIVVQSGTTTIPSGVQLKLLPGATMRVEKGAALNVAGALYSYGNKNVTFPSGYTFFKDSRINYPHAYTAYSYKESLKVQYTATTPAVVCVSGTATFNGTVGVEVTGENGGQVIINTDRVSSAITEDDTPGSEAIPYQVTLDGMGLNGNKTHTPFARGTWTYEGTGTSGQWVGDYYQVIYNANGGTLTGEETELYNPEETAIKTTEPTRDYFTFTGWYYDEACESKADVLSQAAGDVITLYAGWEAIEYQIEFRVGYLSAKIDQNAITIPTESRTWSYGDTLGNLPQPSWDEASMLGLVFSGWRINKDYSGQFDSINNENVGQFDIEGNKIIVYGSFILDNEFAVHFNSNSTFYQAEDAAQYKQNSLYAHGELPNDVTGEYGKAVSRISEATAVITSAVKDDNTHEYYFNGWYVIVNGEHQPVDANTPIPQDWLTDKTLELYADWEQKASIRVNVYNNSANSVATVNVKLQPQGGSQFTINSSGTNPTYHYYYYREGTSITCTFTMYGGLLGTLTDSLMSIQGAASGDMSIKSTTGRSGESYTFTMPVAEQPVKIEAIGDTEGCLVEGTLIMMADGTQKPVEEVKASDEIIVFNHETGKYETGTLWIMLHANLERDMYRIVNLQFSNGSTVRIVDSHGFFDRTLGKYVFIMESNVADFIGHEFSSVEMNGGTFVDGKATLISASVTEEEVKIYSPISANSMNVVAEGILTTTPITGLSEGLYNAFAYDDDMKFNEETMQADIEKYGLYTYEDFKDLIPYEIFEAAPWDRLKVAVGKGWITWEGILWNVNYLFQNGFVG